MSNNTVAVSKCWFKPNNLRMSEMPRNVGKRLTTVRSQTPSRMTSEYSVERMRKMPVQCDSVKGKMHRKIGRNNHGVSSGYWKHSSSERRIVTSRAAASEGEANSTNVMPAITTRERNGEIVDDTVFNISQVSFGSIGSVTGVIFLVYGFLAYFDVVPGGPVSSLILTYGFPITILGFALKYAELKPVPCVTYSKASGLRDRQATSILKQVKDDVTRFRYGDEQHLDLAMERIFRIGRGGGVPRRECPVLTGVREEISETNGNYALVLEFDAKKLGLDGFDTYQQKFQTFFGPGITSEMKKSPVTETGVDVWLISVGDSAGGQTDEDVEILPPLMPGLPARRQVKSTSDQSN